MNRVERWFVSFRADARPQEQERRGFDKTPKTRLFIYSLQHAAFTIIAFGQGKPHLRSATGKAPVPSVPLLDRRTTDFFLIASPLKMGRIEPALRTEVQHAQIHRLVSVGHRLLCEKIPSAKTVASNH